MLRDFVGTNRRLCRGLEVRYPDVFKQPTYVSDLKAVVEKQLHHASDVLEVGGIDRPFLERGHGFRYVGMDIEWKPKCDSVYDEFLVQSVEDPIPGAFDLILSVTLLEHVQNNTRSIQQIFKCLKPGGCTTHYVPSKYHPYSMILRAVGPKVQKELIRRLRPNAAAVTGYPAFFDHCSAKEMARLFRQSGFTNVKVSPYYRANDYFAFFVPAFLTVTAAERVFQGADWQQLAAGFIITGTKPGRTKPGSAPDPTRT